MEKWIDSEVTQLLKKNFFKDSNANYASMTNILNRLNVPCYFSPDTYWTAIHLRNWLEGDYTMFDQQQYRKSVVSLLYFKHVIQGKSIEIILPELNSETIVHPDTAFPWTEKSLSEFLPEVRGSLRSKEITYLKQLKCLYGCGKNITRPESLGPLNNREE